MRGIQLVQIQSGYYSVRDAQFPGAIDGVFSAPVILNRCVKMLEYLRY
jgi:hypothetical protein